MKRHVINALALLFGLLIGGSFVFIADAHAGVIKFPTPSTLVPNSLASVTTQGANVAWSYPIQQAITSGRQAVVIPITATRVVTAATVGRLALGVARGTIQGMVVQAALTAAIQQAGYECDLSGCRKVASGTGELLSEPVTVTNTYYYQNMQGCNVSASSMSAMAAAVNACSYIEGHSRAYYGSDAFTGEPMNPGSTTLRIVWHSNGQSGTVLQINAVQSYTCDPGWTKNGSNCTRPACPTGQIYGSEITCHIPATLTDEQFVTDVYPQIPNNLKPDLIQQAVNAGQSVAADPAILTGPDSVTSPTQTTTDFDPTTNQTTVTTNSTTVNNHYDGDTYTYNVVNNISKTVNGVPAGTTTEQPPDKPDDAATVNDTALPAKPELYKRKYPDGLTGVWSEKLAELKATPLFSLMAIFHPTVTAGSCPAWTFNANIGPHMNFGQGTIAPPCWIWGALKAVLLITALMLCRRIIFGG